MKRVLLFFAITIASISVFGEGFRTLSKNNIIKLEYVAQQEELVVCHFLFLDENQKKDSLLLSFTYLFNRDTIQDYLKICNGFRGDVKSFKVDKGDSIKLLMNLMSADPEVEIKNVNGSLVFKSQDVPEYDSNYYLYTFTGNVWKSKESPLFKVEKSDSVSEKLIFTVTISESYPYDQLFLRLNAITPDQGANTFDLTVDVQTGKMNFKEKTIEVEVKDFIVGEEGTYFFQLFHNHKQLMLNGIHSISYELKEIDD